MRIDIVSDAHWESHIDKVVKVLSSSGYRDIFGPKDYGLGLRGISIVLMCRDPSLDFKQRIRFARKEKRLYIDVMLDLDELRQMSDQERERVVVSHLRDEVPSVIRKYSIRQFEYERFVADFAEWLDTLPKGVVRKDCVG
jgi:hypothetical protein